MLHPFVSVFRAGAAAGALALGLSACGGGSGLPAADVAGNWTAYYQLSQDPCGVTGLPLGAMEHERLYIQQSGSQIRINYPDAISRPAPVSVGSIHNRQIEAVYSKGSYREALSAYVAFDGIIYQAQSVESDPVAWGSACRVTWQAEIWPGWRF